jgi:hypothetical protein
MMDWPMRNWNRCFFARINATAPPPTLRETLRQYDDIGDIYYPLQLIIRCGYCGRKTKHREECVGRGGNPTLHADEWERQ